MLLGAGTPIERAAADAIAAGTDAAPHRRPRLRPARRRSALLDACDVVVAPDTGPVHICVALDVPAVALFGYTNPKRFGPYRRFGDLLVDAFGDPGEDYSAAARYRAGRMARITVETVAGEGRGSRWSATRAERRGGGLGGR